MPMPSRSLHSVCTTSAWIPHRRQPQWPHSQPISLRIPSVATSLARITATLRSTSSRTACALSESSSHLRSLASSIARSRSRVHPRRRRVAALASARVGGVPERTALCSRARSASSFTDRSSASCGESARASLLLRAPSRPGGPSCQAKLEPATPLSPMLAKTSSACRRPSPRPAAGLTRRVAANARPLQQSQATAPSCSPRGRPCAVELPLACHLFVCRGQSGQETELGRALRGMPAAAILMKERTCDRPRVSGQTR
mmetsp:Transcript_24927/g.58725  ORF Transcript_24927/g.58725 Transcript_24927/m.58725 type:complete len:258 (-) Transcript_24927:20-793(-)